MPASLSLPSNADLSFVAQEMMPLLTASDPIFQFCPITTDNVDTIEWEQEDNFFGLMEPRSLNGAFNSIKRIGAKRYALVPGYYGEHYPIDERDITQRRILGEFGEPEPTAAMVLRATRLLTHRAINRMANAAWALFSAGSYTTIDRDGNTLYTDSILSSMTQTRFSTWATLASATPLQDFRNLKPLARGKGCEFNGKAVAFMNTTTSKNLLNNSNNSDLAGRIVYPVGSGGGGVNATDLPQLNSILSNADLPQIVEWDGGYFATQSAANSGNYLNWTLHIPDNKVIIIGFRPTREPIAKVIQTRNAQNAAASAGLYLDAVMPQNPPYAPNVYSGVNFGIATYYPSNIVIADCS
jgi:hypothetical protein